jgi:hypothetical protein
MGDWNSVIEDKAFQNVAGQHGLEGKNREVKVSLTLVRGMDLSSLTHGLRSIREDCTLKSTSRWKLTPVGLNAFEALIQNSEKDVQKMPRTDVVCDHKLLDANICTRLKKVIKFQKGKRDGIWKSYMLNNSRCKIL